MNNDLKAKILGLEPSNPHPCCGPFSDWAHGFRAGRSAAAEVVAAEPDDIASNPFTDLLLSVINDVQDALGFTNEDKECTNGSLEMVAAIDRLKSAATSAEQAAPKCACGLPTCVEPWEPGCGLGQSEEHARVVPDQAEASPYAGQVPAAWEVRLQNYNGDAYTKAITFDGAEAKDWEVKGAKIVPVFYDSSEAPVAQAHTAKGLYFDEHQEALNEAAAQPVEPQADAKEGGK